VGGIKAKSSRIPDIFPKEFLVAPHFIPYVLANVVLLFTCIAKPKGRNPILQNRTLYFEGLPFFSFFWIDGPIKLTHCRKKKLNFGSTSSN
jgi:hypothetical protein